MLSVFIADYHALVIDRGDQKFVGVSGGIETQDREAVYEGHGALLFFTVNGLSDDGATAQPVALFATTGFNGGDE